MRDPRVALAFLALVAIALGARRCLARPAVAFLAGFLLLSYLLWLLVFSIYRYAVLIEMLSSLLALLAVAASSPPRQRRLRAGRPAGGGKRRGDRPSGLGPRPVRGRATWTRRCRNSPAKSVLLLGRDEPLAYLAAVTPAEIPLRRPFRPGPIRPRQPLRGPPARGPARGAAHLRPGAGTRRRRWRSSGAARLARGDRLLPTGVHQLDQRRPRPAGLPGCERGPRRRFPVAAARPQRPARRVALRHGGGGAHARRPTRAALHTEATLLGRPRGAAGSSPTVGEPRFASSRTPRPSASKRARSSGRRRPRRAAVAPLPRRGLSPARRGMPRLKGRPACLRRTGAASSEMRSPRRLGKARLATANARTQT